MQKITLTHQDETDSIRMEINCEDMFLSDVISRIRSFLLAMSYDEESVDKFILNPHAEYSLLSFEDQYNMKLKIELPNECEEEFLEDVQEEKDLKYSREELNKMSKERLYEICDTIGFDCVGCPICDAFEENCEECPRSR